MARLLITGDARSIHIQRWCRYFIESGHEVALFSLEPKTFPEPVQFYAGSRPTGIGIVDYYLARRKYRRVLDRFRPDIVNAHYAVSYGWLAAISDRCPVIVTAWGSDLLLLPRKSFLHCRRIARALEHADYCTVDNANLEKAAAAFIPHEKIIRIVMGVSRAFLEKANPIEHDSSGPLRIIAPRGLEEVYDPDSIIEAAGLLKNKCEFTITMLGKGEKAEKLKKALEKKGLDDWVKIEPSMPHDDYLGYLRHFDIYLSASRSDSTSVALLEAMAVGLFPVVSGIEGNREWIKDKINGLVFTPGSAASIVEAIGETKTFRHRFAEIATQNRKRIETEAVWEDNMTRIEELLEGLIHAR